MRMTLRSRLAVSVLTGLSMAALASCGGGGSPAEPTASPTPTPAPQPTPTPVPAPTIRPGQEGLAAGPVASVKAYIKTLESPTRGSGVYRDPVKDANGVFIVYVGEYVVIDSTQRNEAGQV